MNQYDEPLAAELGLTWHSQTPSTSEGLVSQTLRVVLVHGSVIPDPPSLALGVWLCQIKLG